MSESTPAALLGGERRATVAEFSLAEYRERLASLAQVEQGARLVAKSLSGLKDVAEYDRLRRRAEDAVEDLERIANRAKFMLFGSQDPVDIDAEARAEEEQDAEEEEENE